MTLPHYFHLGIDAEDYVSPTYSVSYSNWDLDEGLPYDELTEVVFEADFCIDKLPEERPDACCGIVIDEADFGDE